MNPGPIPGMGGIANFANGGANANGGGRSMQRHESIGGAHLSSESRQMMVLNEQMKGLRGSRGRSNILPKYT